MSFDENENPFEKVAVFLGVQGGAEVSWIPKASLPQYPAPWTFRVEVAPTPVAPWVAVGTVSSANWYLADPARYKYDTLAEVWYRVVLVDADEAEHPGAPVQPGSVLNRRDWINAREICRQAYQRLRLETGRPGWLLKRKQFWGPLCETCGRETTGSNTNSQCPECYGVGITGGYYEPFPMTLEFGRYGIEAVDEPSGGYRQHNDILAVNFPRIDPLDVWIDKLSDRRFAIQPRIETVTSHRGIPLVVGLRLSPIETKDVVYTIARPSTNSPMSPAASSIGGLYSSSEYFR
jgi:hypothetical protein